MYIIKAPPIEVKPYSVFEQILLELSCELAHMNQSRDADIHILTSPMGCGRSLYQIATGSDCGIDEARTILRKAVA